MHDKQYLDDVNELLFVDPFANENDFSANLHEGGIAGVAQENKDQDDDNNNDDANTDEDPGNPN